MKVFLGRFSAAAAVFVLGFHLSIAAAPSLPPANAAATVSEVVLKLDPSQSSVHWEVDSTLHTVHGTFKFTSGTIHFDPETGKASGEILVNAPSGESGNGSRDKRMHKEILETAKYQEIVFHPTQIEGRVAPAGPSDVKLNGVFSIHGADHEVSVPVHAELTGDHWTGTGKFPVPYVKWGIKDPSNFLLKVKPVVDVKVELSGTLPSQR
jgi:polyisoprenoid-binding protein YceI